MNETHYIHDLKIEIMDINATDCPYRVTNLVTGESFMCPVESDAWHNCEALLAATKSNQEYLLYSLNRPDHEAVKIEPVSEPLTMNETRQLEYSRMDRGSLHYFIDTHFPDKTADLTSVLLLFGWINEPGLRSDEADFTIGSVAGFNGSVKPREWYVEAQFGGTTIRIWPYGQYVGCRPDGVYHIADVMPSGALENGFIIHFLSDGTIKAGRTYEGG